MSEDAQDDSEDGGSFGTPGAVETAGCCLIELFGALGIVAGLILLPLWPLG